MNDRSPEEELTEESCPGFLARFYGFTDAVLREVTVGSAYGWFTKSAPADWVAGVHPAEIMISCRELDGGEEWVNVHLRMADVVEGRLGVFGSRASWVISDGLKIGWTDGTCFIDFDSWEDFSLERCRASTTYLASKRVFWSTSPYDR